jgi:cell division transport system permease protein
MMHKRYPRHRDFQLQIWLQRHVQVCLASLGRLARAPLGSLMTSAVIGIALALPMGLHVMLANLQALSGSWDSAASISLFLKPGISDAQAAQLADELRQEPRIASIGMISKASALDEFRRLSGLGKALDALDNNPLPSLLVIHPKVDSSDLRLAQQLVQELSRLPQADIVQLDLEWVQRLQAITQIAQRGVLLLGSLLGLAVLLIVGNTIRLEIQNRHAEIEISKLIGATNAFIRRPFLYIGLWHGLFGGLLAWILVSFSIGMLSGPVSKLAGLYRSAFELAYLDAWSILLLLGGGAGLGLIGAWLAVGRHLHEIQPA